MNQSEKETSRLNNFEMLCWLCIFHVSGLFLAVWLIDFAPGFLRKKQRLSNQSLGYLYTILQFLTLKRRMCEAYLVLKLFNGPGIVLQSNNGWNCNFILMKDCVIVVKMVLVSRIHYFDINKFYKIYKFANLIFILDSISLPRSKYCTAGTGKLVSSLQSGSRISWKGLGHQFWIEL